MQAAMAATAAQSILSLSIGAAPSQPLLHYFSNNPSSQSLQHSSLLGISLKLPRQSLNPAAVSPKPLAVVAATKKAVAVLKGNSQVEGVVTLTQENDGQLALLLSCRIFIY